MNGTKIKKSRMHIHSLKVMILRIGSHLHFETKDLTVIVNGVTKDIRNRIHC